MTLSSGTTLLSSYYYGRWRHGYVGWTSFIVVIHIYMKSGLSLSFYLVALISSYYACNVRICAKFWFTKYRLPLSSCACDGSSIVNLNGLDLSQSNYARVALCLGLVNQTRISSGCSSHEWLWSMLNPTHHFALGNHARFLWGEQAWPKCIIE